MRRLLPSFPRSSRFGAPIARVVAAATACVAMLATSPVAAASRPYIVLRDDGTLNGTVTSPSATLASVLNAYDASGATRPDVISLWTAFPMNKNTIETLFAPASNDVRGIGLENVYGGDGVGTSAYPPVRALLLHNDVRALDARAAKEKLPAEGFAEYLFLLELSHLWGPAARVPKTDGGAQDALIGFPFHWSFWMDAGGSPAGGNRWKDNGNGTFSTLPQSPSTVTFSMLDLYLMGLADPSEVPPFGLLENAVPPADVEDSFTGRPLSKESFPHFGTEPVTVTATRRTFTVADIIAANGPRVPARKDAPKAFTLGIVLSVAKNASDEEIAAAQTAMDAVAPKLAPAFERATRGRGKLEVVTRSDAPTEDIGGREWEAPPSPPTEASTSDDGGCSATGASSAPALGGLALLGGAFALLRRRRPSRR